MYLAKLCARKRIMKTAVDIPSNFKEEFYHA